MSASVELAGDWEERVRGALARAGGVGEELGRGRVAVLGAGLDSVALVAEGVSGRFVLRLPKGEDGAEGIAREGRLLPELGERVGLPIPRFVLMARNPLGPGEFCVYPMVPGEVVSAREWHRRGLVGAGTARQVAGFLDEVHGFSVERAVELGVEVADYREEFEETLELLGAHVVPMLEHAEARVLVEAFEGYLGDAENFAYEPTLIHGDVSLDHLLITGDRISGVIDFGDTQIGDPDYDLCYLWTEAGPEFVRQVREYRGLPFDERLTGKLNFWAIADPTDDVLHGIENDMPEFRDSSRNRLVRALERYAAQTGTL
ncbi:phosphotransferase family protein [Nocardia sp. NPDC050406]|uniref:phosphotransferase family protein n=1 Tax=Nocardia sp. NPDC050406 TaxID=3364318 RepID=UPI0037A951CC